MRYTIIGAGALGSLLGARLHHHGVDVEVVDTDPARLERLARPVAVRGYRLGPATTLHPVTWDTARRERDALLLCVPPSAVPAALERAREVFDQGAVMVAFSGGIEVITQFAAWPGERLHAVTNLEVRLNADGEPETGFHNFTWLGNQEATETDAMRAVQRDLAWVGPTLTTKVIEGMVWSKAVFELEAALPVLASATPADVFETDAGVAMAAELVREALAVAEANGVEPIAFDFFDPNLYHTTTTGERATLYAWIRHCWQRHEQFRVGAAAAFSEPAGLGWSLDPRNPASELGVVLTQLRDAARAAGHAAPRLERLAAVVARGGVDGVDALAAALRDEVPA